MDKINKLFEDLGLQPKEVSLLLFLISSGQATITEIVKATKIKRSTVYFLLESLRQKKLASFIQKGSHRFYSAASLHEMKQILQEEKERLDMRIDELDALAPELAALMPRSLDKPRVTSFEGRAGMRELLDHMLQFETQPIYYIGDPAIHQTAAGKAYHQKFISLRIAKKIRTKAIWTYPYHTHALKGGEQFLREVRYAPKDFIAPTGIFIYGNCVSIFSGSREVFGIIIHSQNFFETMRSWFNVLWLGCSEKIPD